MMLAGRTVSAVAAEAPLALAVTLAEPTARGISSPAGSTVAIAGLLLDHVTDAPLTSLPFLSRTCATSCSGVPTVAVVVAGNVTVLVAFAGARLDARAVAVGDSSRAGAAFSPEPPPQATIVVSRRVAAK